MFNLPDIVNWLAYCRHEYYTHYYYTHITDPHSHPSPISSCKIFWLQNSWILYLLVCIIGSWCWNWGIQKLTLYQHIDSGKAWKSDCKLPQCHLQKIVATWYGRGMGMWVCYVCSNSVCSTHVCSMPTSLQYQEDWTSHNGMSTFLIASFSHVSEAPQGYVS